MIAVVIIRLKKFMIYKIHIVSQKAIENGDREIHTGSHIVLRNSDSIPQTIS